MSAYQYIYIYIYVHKRKTKKNATIVATVPFGTVATVQNLNKRVIKKKKRLTKLLLQLQCCTVKYVGCTVSKHCSGIVKNTNERLKKCNYCSYSAAWHRSYCAKLKQRVKKKTHEITVATTVLHSEIRWMHSAEAL